MHKTGKRPEPSMSVHLQCLNILPFTLTDELGLCDRNERPTILPLGSQEARAINQTPVTLSTVLWIENARHL